MAGNMLFGDCEHIGMGGRHLPKLTISIEWGKTISSGGNSPKSPPKEYPCDRYKSQCEDCFSLFPVKFWKFTSNFNCYQRFLKSHCFHFHKISQNYKNHKSNCNQALMANA